MVSLPSAEISGWVFVDGLTDNWLGLRLCPAVLGVNCWAENGAGKNRRFLKTYRRLRPITIHRLLRSVFTKRSVIYNIPSAPWLCRGLVRYRRLHDWDACTHTNRRVLLAFPGKEILTD